jgi:hypothetical protein
VGYKIALQAAEDRLERIHYIEVEAWNTGLALEFAQGNLERWLNNWGL